MQLQEMARAAHKTETEAEELERFEANRKAASEAGKWIKENWGVTVDDFDADNGTVLVDGLTFAPRYYHREYGPAEIAGVAAKGLCPSCGEVAWTTTLVQLRYLGEQLTNFRPDYGHYCNQRPDPNQSLGARLENLIREIIQSEIETE